MSRTQAMAIKGKSLTGTVYFPGYKSFDEDYIRRTIIEKCRNVMEEKLIQKIMPVECVISFGTPLYIWLNEIMHSPGFIVGRSDDLIVVQIRFQAKYHESELHNMPDLSWVKDFLWENAEKYGEPE